MPPRRPCRRVEELGLGHDLDHDGGHVRLPGCRRWWMRQVYRRTAAATRSASAPYPPASGWNPSDATERPSNPGDEARRRPPEPRERPPVASPRACAPSANRSGCGSTANAAERGRTDDDQSRLGVARAQGVEQARRGRRRTRWPIAAGSRRSSRRARPRGRRDRSAPRPGDVRAPRQRWRRSRRRCARRLTRAGAAPAGRPSHPASARPRSRRRRVAQDQQAQRVGRTRAAGPRFCGWHPWGAALQPAPLHDHQGRAKDRRPRARAAR